MATHEVFNQVPPFENVDLLALDPTLTAALVANKAEWAHDLITAYARQAGSAALIKAGFLSNENPPILHTHDNRGNRRDEVEFHPAYHDLMRTALSHGMHSLPWCNPQPGAHVARAALLYLASQVESGHTCPVSMTYAAIPALRKNPALAEAWEPLITSRDYDPAFRPAPEKNGITIGMAMTEKQGGSDVRANTTRAIAINADEYEITGHKWFCSAPMSDAFLVLAQAPGGLTCFFLPRWRPDGTRNAFYLQRLKSKLGNRSNASSEVEFENAWAVRIGEEGRGVPTIIEMVNHTRLDCVLGSAGLIRQALLQAAHHTAHRSAFRKKLSDQPLMRAVLADLAAEAAAATWLAMRLAAGFDARESDEQERAFTRLTAALAKFWVCKRAPVLVGEALECLGGNGYVETSMMPRLYREAPLLSIWEGSGNVICLDVLRAIHKEPASLEAVRAEIAKAAGQHPALDAFLAEPFNAPAESEARYFVERLAVALQGSLLLRHAAPATADLFCRTRLAGEGGRTIGSLPGGVNTNDVLTSELSWW